MIFDTVVRISSLNFLQTEIPTLGVVAYPQSEHSGGRGRRVMFPKTFFKVVYIIDFYWFSISLVHVP